MGYSIKEAIAYYIKSGYEGDMAVSVDESPEIRAVGMRDGKIVPIVEPGSTLTAEEIMEKAGIHESSHPKRKGVHILGNLPIAVLPSRLKKPPHRLH